MNYIEELAHLIHDRAFPGNRLHDDGLPLYRIYAVLCLVKGQGVTAEDVHDAWVAWRFGSVPEHPSCIPFSSLAARVQRLDDPFVDAIHAVAPYAQSLRFHAQPTVRQHD